MEGVRLGFGDARYLQVEWRFRSTSSRRVRPHRLRLTVAPTPVRGDVFPGGHGQALATSPRLEGKAMSSCLGSTRTVQPNWPVRSIGTAPANFALPSS